MSDNIRRFRAVRKAIERLYPQQPKGNTARHLTTLAAMIAGITGAKHTHLPKIAEKAPDHSKKESRVKKLSRWLSNENITYEIYFLPFLMPLIEQLAQQTIALVFDGSTTGRGCITLMASIVYKKRAIPIAWITIEGKKGHMNEALHLELLERVRSVLPERADVVFLGDGEFDGTTLLERITDYRWDYVCRTAKNATLFEGNEKFRFKEVGPDEDVEYVNLPGLRFTHRRYGPVHAIVWWRRGYVEPVYLITNMDLAEEACRWYKKRFRIETFFSDQKSRGFHLHKSHVSAPERIARLLIGSCLAYIWMICLGVLVFERKWYTLFHRSDRCDLSLFQLGLGFLEHCLNESWRIWVYFSLPRLGGAGDDSLFLQHLQPVETSL